MADHRLGRRRRDLARARPQEGPHCERLDPVVLPRRGAVQVDVVHVGCGRPRGAQSQLHGPGGLGAVVAHVDPVVRVAGRAVARDLAVDARPASLRVPGVLQHHQEGALPEHEAAAVAIERTGRPPGAVVPADRGGPHAAETLHHPGGDARLGPAGQEDRRLFPQDGVHGVAEGVGAAGAAVAQHMRGSGEAEADAQLAADHSDHGGRDGERVDPPYSLTVIGLVLAFGEVDGAGAASDDDPDAPARLERQVAPETRIEERLARRGDRKRHDPADAIQVFRVEVGRGIERGNLRRHLARQVVRVEQRDAPGGAPSLAQPVPERLHPEAEGGNDAETGHNGGHRHRVYHPVPGASTREATRATPRPRRRRQSANRRA